MRDPALGAADWVLKVDAFWYQAAMLNECYRGVLDVAPKGAVRVGAAAGAAWHGCAALLRDGDVRGLTAFVHRLLDGAGSGALATRAGLGDARKLLALRVMREAVRGRWGVRPFPTAFAALAKAARRKADVAVVADLAAAAKRPFGTGP